MKDLRSTLDSMRPLVRLLRRQLRNWKTAICKEMQFGLLCLFTALAGAVATPFQKLPEGWFDAVAAHVFTVPGAFVAFMLAAFFVATVGMTVLAGKVARVL